jgi:hypothetical protein
MSGFDPFGAPPPDPADSALPATSPADPRPSRIGRSLGAARLAVGVGFLAAPVASTRVLGLDTATAKRIRFLARMAAVRDLVLGAGTLAAGRDPRALRRWVAAGAVADLGDAIVIGTATRSGVTGGIPAGAIVAGAAGAALVGGWAAAGLRD